MSESHLDQFWSMTFEERELLYNLNPDDFHELSRGAIQELLALAPPEKQNEVKLIQYEIDNALRNLDGTERLYVYMQIFAEGFRKFQAVMNGDYTVCQDKNEVVLDEDLNIE